MVTLKTSLTNLHYNTSVFVFGHFHSERYLKFQLIIKMFPGSCNSDCNDGRDIHDDDNDDYLPFCS